MAAAGMAWLGMSVAGGVWALPVGANVTHGDATITSDGTQMVIQQHTDKLITDWTSFDISSGQKVRFEQPGKDSAALNKIHPSSVTQIHGNLESNGRVFLISPAGLLFGRTSQVNVGGLIATTKTIRDEDFVQGRYVFNGSSSSALYNAGTINVQEGGGVALLASRVTNDGTIRAEMGTIALAAGGAFTLTFEGNQLLNLQIDKETAGAMIENAGLLSANGGQVVLSANAAAASLNAVVNSVGIIEANTLNGSTGRIVLDGGPHGAVLVAGNLSASALSGTGNGGAVSIRGRDVRLKQSTQVDTRARQGSGGVLNIDATSINVGPHASSVNGITMTHSTLNQNLATTAISLTATAGDLSVNGPVAWASQNGLALNARGNVVVNHTVQSSGNEVHVSLNAGERVQLNRSLSVTGSRGRITMNARDGHELADGASVILSGSQAEYSANGQAYEVIQNLSQFRAIDQNLNGSYVLGNSIRGDKNFQALGAANGPFTGTLDGLGHTLDTFSVTGSGPNVGIFASSAGSIHNLTLKSVTISAPHNNLAGISMGSLAGLNTGDVYNVKSWNVSVQGAANRGNVIGGLVGVNRGGRIERASVSGSVQANSYTRAAGGLVGENLNGSGRHGLIGGSASAATVAGQMQSSPTGGMGGLVGVNRNAEIRDSKAQGKTAVDSDGVNVGGLVGYNSSVVEHSRATGLVQGGKHGNTGGLVGKANNGVIMNSAATGTVQAYGGGSTGGAVGTNSNGGKLFNVVATGTVADWHGRNVGGLVGSNQGEFSLIDEGNSSGHVDVRNSPAMAYVGGLVGYNNGLITDSESRSSVTTGHGAQVGGFAGYNDGVLQRVAAHGTVHAGPHSSVGALVGGNAGLINIAVASGDVWGAHQSRIGGIAGVNLNGGEIQNATSRSVLDGGYQSTIGGIAGFNQGLIDASHAKGYVRDHWYTWMLKQTRGTVAGANTGVVQ